MISTLHFVVCLMQSVGIQKAPNAILKTATNVFLTKMEAGFLAFSMDCGGTYLHTRMDRSITKTVIYQMQLSHCFCWLILPENRLNTCKGWDFKQHFKNYLCSEWELCKLDLPMLSNSEPAILTR